MLAPCLLHGTLVHLVSGLLPSLASVELAEAILSMFYLPRPTQLQTGGHLRLALCIDPIAPDRWLAKLTPCPGPCGIRMVSDYLGFAPHLGHQSEAGVYKNIFFSFDI